MPRINQIDEALREAVETALATHLADAEARTRAVEDVTAAVVQKAGAAAQRRRLLSGLRSAFKEGFLSGRVAGRAAHWHDEIWKQSSIARSLREPAKRNGEAEDRYAGFNY